MVAPHGPRTGDLTHNPGMCPDWESNLRPLASQAHAQSTELYLPRLRILEFPKQVTWAGHHAHVMLVNPHRSGGCLSSSEMGAGARGERMIYPRSHSRQTVRSETIRPKISNWFSLMPKSVFVLLCLLGTEQWRVAWVPAGAERCWTRNRL